MGKDSHFQARNELIALNQRQRAESSASTEVPSRGKSWVYHWKIMGKSMGIYGNLWEIMGKSIGFYGNLWEIMENLWDMCKIFWVNP